MPFSSRRSAGMQQLLEVQQQRGERRAQLVRGDGEELLAQGDGPASLPVQAGVVDGEGNTMGQVGDRLQVLRHRSNRAFQKTESAIPPRSRAAIGTRTMDWHPSPSSNPIAVGSEIRVRSSPASRVWSSSRDTF